MQSTKWAARRASKSVNLAAHHGNTIGGRVGSPKREAAAAKNYYQGKQGRFNKHAINQHNGHKITMH